MSAIPHVFMTEAEYLAFETAATEKHHYVNGQVYAMSGAAYGHALVTMSVGAALHRALNKGPCRVLSSDARLRAQATGMYTYADVVVVCGKPVTVGPRPQSLTNPSAIVEVLSPSTAADDRGWKWEHYRRIPSLMTYVLVDPVATRIEVYTRNPDDTWTFAEAVGRDGSIALPALAIALSLAEVFEGTEGLGPDGEIASAADDPIA